MTIDTKDMLNSILSSISRIDYVRPDSIPNIELYMDQVTTFMEKELSSTKRFPEDKILTKTMINNYAKNNLLPPPVKKKYSREHILVLIFIYYFKNILSIKDIETLLAPITGKYFDNGGSFRPYFYLRGDMPDREGTYRFPSERGGPRAQDCHGKLCRSAGRRREGLSAAFLVHMQPELRRVCEKAHYRKAHRRTARTGQ